MKRKNLFLMFGLGVALLLSSCSQDEVENNEGGMAAQSVACFSSGSSAETTRTSMDYMGAFYWTLGDYIFVKNGSAYVPSSNAADSKKTRENFYMPGEWTADEYPIIYTGNGKNTPSGATSVEVKDFQNQTVADNADHLGSSGDCGNAVAWKVSENSYYFDLIHRASYFVIAPRHSFTGKTVTLQKVEVTTTGSDFLCGSYNFDESTTTLKGNLRGNSGKKTITLTTSDFTIPTVDEVNADNNRFADARGYMVFQPGVHTLTFKYYVTIDGTPREFEKKVSSREFQAGFFTNVKHILADGMFNGGHAYLTMADDISDGPHGTISETTYASATLYKWDGPYPYLSSYNISVTWPTNPSEIAAQSAQYSCKDMPNANEMYWYIVNGDPRWDETTPWTIDGGLTEYTNGLWLKKKATILAEGKEFSSTVGKDGVDMRLTFKGHSVRNSLTSLSVAERSKYFFLPALGYKNGGVQYVWRIHGYYWSSSPFPGDGERGYAMSFSHNASGVSGYRRARGMLAGSEWFK